MYIILFFMLASHGYAQDIVYQVKYQQEVYSNYNNLLSGSKKEDFKQYITTLSAWLNVSFTDSNRLVMQIVPFDTFATAVHMSPVTVWASLDENRKIDQLHFSNIPPRQDEIMIKTLLSFIQYFQVSNIPAGCCSKEEFIDGLYSAAYTDLVTDYKKNTYRLSKRITADENAAGAENLQRIIFDRYQAVYYANASTGFIDTISITEKKHQKVQNKIVAFIKSTFSLNRLENRKVADLSGLFFDTDKMYSTRLYNKPDQELRNKLISERVLQNQSFDSLVYRLKEIRQLSFEQRVQLASRFRAFLFLNPGRSGDFRSLLDSYANNSDEYSLLLDAVVNTPSPAVQHIITDLVIRYRDDGHALRGLIPKAATAVLPDRELLNTLLDLKLHSPVSDISSMSGLCLSNLLRSIKVSSPYLYDSIKTALGNFYTRQTNNEDNSIQFLLEAGNIGDPVFADPIIALVRSADINLQKEALYALRFIQDLKVDSLLALQFSQNPDSARFASIYETIKIRRLSPIMQKHIIKYISQHGSKNEKGCLLLLTYIANYIDESPGLAGGLKTIRSTAKINEAINEILEKYRSYQAFMNN